MLLRCLAYPTQLCDVEMQFGWERSRFSHIHWVCTLIIFERCMHLLHFDKERLTPEKLDEFAKAVESKGAPLGLFLAFINGTLDPQSRPVRNQHLIYNGWKCIHCLKFHSLVTPNGLHMVLSKAVDTMQHFTNRVALLQSSTNTSMLWMAKPCLSTAIQHMVLDLTSFRHSKDLQLLKIKPYGTQK